MELKQQIWYRIIGVNSMLCDIPLEKLDFNRWPHLKRWLYGEKVINGA